MKSCTGVLEHGVGPHSQDITHRAFFLSLGAAAIFVAALFGLSFVHTDVGDVYFFWHIKEYAIVSTRWQILFYACFLVLFSLSVPYASTRPDSGPPPASPLALDYAFALFSCLVLMLCQFHPWFLPGLGAAVLMICLLTWAARPGMPCPAVVSLRLAVGASAVVFFAAFYILPRSFPLFISDKAFLSNLELHYAMSVLPGFEFGSGMQHGLIGKQYYGFSMSLLMAAAAWALGFIESEMTRLALAVKLLQLTALAIFLAALYVLNRRNFLFLCLVALCMTAALTTVGLPVYFPNQAGVRYVPLLAGLLFLAWQRRAKRPGLPRFALASGLMIAANPETGLAFCAGSMLFLGAGRLDETGRWRAALAAMLGGGLLSLAIFAVVYQSLSLLLVENVQPDFFSNIRTFGQGLGGIVSRPHLMAPLVLVLAAHAVARGFFRAQKGRLTGTDAYQTAVGGVMLVWLVYYVAREDEWNIWFQSLLLLALVAPRLKRPFRLLDTIRSRPARYMAVLAILAFTASSVTAFMYHRSYSSHIRFFFIQPKMFADLAGREALYFMNPDDKAAYEDKMRALGGLADKDDAVVLSNYPVSVRLQGFNAHFPWYDVFGEINSLSKAAMFVAWMAEHGGACLILDDPQSPLTAATPAHVEHYAHVLAALGRYREVKRESGWIVYRRALP